MDTWVYEANTAEQTNFLILGTVLLVAGVIGFWMVRSRPAGMAPGFRSLGYLLSGFAAVIALGILVFTSWTLSKLPDIEIDAQGISYGREQLSWQDVRRIYLQTEASGGNPFLQAEGPTTLLLVIEKPDRSIWVLSEANYDIRNIEATATTYLQKRQ